MPHTDFSFFLKRVHPNSVNNYADTTLALSPHLFPHPETGARVTPTRSERLWGKTSYITLHYTRRVATCNNLMQFLCFFFSQPKTCYLFSFAKKKVEFSLSVRFLEMFS